MSLEDMVDERIAITWESHATSAAIETMPPLPCWHRPITLAIWLEKKKRKTQIDSKHDNEFYSPIFNKIIGLR